MIGLVALSGLGFLAAFTAFILFSIMADIGVKFPMIVPVDRYRRIAHRFGIVAAVCFVLFFASQALR